MNRRALRRLAVWPLAVLLALALLPAPGRAVLEGDVETGSVMSGQVAGMLHEIRPVRAILEDLWSGCAARLTELEKEGF